MKAAERKAKKAAEGGAAPKKSKWGRKRAAALSEDESEPDSEQICRACTPWMCLNSEIHFCLGLLANVSKSWHAYWRTAYWCTCT